MNNLIEGTKIYKADKTVGAFTEKINDFVVKTNKDYWSVSARERSENWKSFLNDLQSLSSTTFVIAKNTKEIETPRWLKTDWQQEVSQTLRDYFKNRAEINKEIIRFYQENGGGNKIEAIKNNVKEYCKLRFKTNEKLEENEEQLVKNLTLLTFRSADNSIDKNLQSELRKGLADYQAQKEWLDNLRSSIDPDLPEFKKAILREFISNQYRENLDNLLGKAYHVAGPEKKLSAWQQMIGEDGRKIDIVRGNDSELNIDAIVNKKIEEMSFSQAVGATLSQFRWEQRQVLKQMAQFYQEHGGGDKFLAIRNATEEYKVLRSQINSELESTEYKFIQNLLDISDGHPDRSSPELRRVLVDLIDKYESEKDRLDEMKQNLRIPGMLPEEQKAELRQEIAEEYRKAQNEFLAGIKNLSQGVIPEKYQEQEQEIQHQTDEGHEQQKNQEVERHEQQMQMEQQEQQEKEKEQEWELELSLG
jgi:hypothetical protein